MTVLRVDDFGGMAPAMNPRNLPPNGAVESINADVRRSALVPIQKGGSVNYVDLPELRPLALFDFPNAIGKLVLKYSAAKWMSEVSEGVYAKWRITDNNVAYVTEGNNPQEVQTISPGVPDPAAAPNVTDSSPNSPQDTAYVVTYVKRAHGIDFESAPSAPATTSQSTGASVTLAFAERNRTDFDKFRVYRTSGGKFLFAAEKGKSETFVDNVSADALGEEVPSADWEYFTTYLWPVNTSFGSIAAIYHGLGDTVAFTGKSGFSMRGRADTGCACPIRSKLWWTTATASPPSPIRTSTCFRGRGPTAFPQGKWGEARQADSYVCLQNARRAWRSGPPRGCLC